MSFNIIKAMQKFYYRLENSETTFPLSYNALLESKVLHNLKKPSWYTSVHSLIEKIKSFLTQRDRSKKINTKMLTSYFIHEWQQNLRNCSDGKLLYLKLTLVVKNI